MLTDFDRLRVVAIRFDVCDRAAPGRCADGADGRLRLVLQPLLRTAETANVVEELAARFPPAP